MRKLIPTLVIAAFAYSIWMGYSPNYLIKRALKGQDTSQHGYSDEMLKTVAKWKNPSPRTIKNPSPRTIKIEIGLSEATLRRQEARRQENARRQEARRQENARRLEEAKRTDELRIRMRRELKEAWQALADKARENDARRADERFQKILDEAKELERRASK